MQIIGFFAMLMFTLILIFLFISFVYFYLYIAKKENLLKAQGYRKGKKKKSSLRNRIVNPLVSWGTKAGPVGMKYPLFLDMPKHERWLKEAGRPLGMTLESFFGFRFVLILIGLGFGSLYTFLGMPFALPILLLSILSGVMGPSLWLYLSAKRRQEAISMMMPDFLDTVSVTLQAGVSLDSALSHVTNQFDGPLSEEIDRFNKEIELGVQRKTAYLNLIDRNSSKELQTLVNALIQGSSLGVAVARTFKLQAEDLRLTRGFKAKEKAAKANPQVTLVTTFFIAPAVFGFIMGLIVLNIIYNPEAFGLDTFFK
ncbi:type II secretion system F family protein [Sporosarcina sp. 179-K 8C2 HS]|uniref:type II secretion system F family protein n=1 Tax=Sporosarcina sp. 179-K 8C2 HS TaxID=3142387 RepID=UPI0039A07030